MIIGVTGYICSGKGTFSDFLRDNYGFNQKSFKDVVAKELKDEGERVDRETLQARGNIRTSQHGEKYWAMKVITHTLPGKDYVVDGFRYPGQINYFNNVNDFFLVGIKADESKRMERYHERRREGDIYVKIADKRDRGLIPGGQRTDACMELVLPENLIENNESVGEFVDRIDNFMKNLRGENAGRLSRTS